MATTALSCILLISGCQKNVSKRTFLMAEVNPPDSVACRMDQFFVDEVKSLSNGAIEIELESSGHLGDETQILSEMFTTKKIDMARISLMALNDYGAEKTSILTIPYLFRNRDHFWKFAKSEYASQVLNESTYTQNGVVGLFLAEEGFRHFFSTRRIESVNDFSGLKVRTTNDPIMMAVVLSLGATPVQIPFFDIIKEMVIDNIQIAEQPIVNYKSNDFDAVAPNIILDGHTIGVIEVIITKEAWASLTPTYQKILREAGSKAADYCRKICEEEEEEVIKELKKKGVHFTEVKDKTPWQKICSETISAQAQKDLPLFNTIIGME